jgi:RNA polymerase sigma-70 factor (ECF subfamily)
MSSPDEPGQPPASASEAADPGRFVAIIEQNHRVVWRSLRRFGVPECDIDDACQRVFLIASRRLTDILPDSERAFLLRTALRVAKDFRRSRARRREADGLDLSTLPGDVESPEELSDQKRARSILDGALEQLPMNLRTVFVLFEIEELTMLEIARVLEIPAGTVASRLRTARQLFRRTVAQLSGRVMPRAAGARR